MIKTKFLAVSFFLFFIAAFSFNASSEVLVYKWKLTGTKNLSINNGETYDRTVLSQKGYLVVNFDPVSGTYTDPLNPLAKPTIIKYWVQGINKYYITDTLLNDTATFENKEFSGSYYVIISGFIGKNRAEMYSGKVGNGVTAVQSGGASFLNVAKSLSGSAAWNESAAEIILSSGTGRTNLQLDMTLTKNANLSGQTVAQVIGALQNAIALKGYAGQAPFAQDDNATMDMRVRIADVGVNIHVLANDYDVNPGATLSVTAINTQPVNGTAVINIDNTITYTPNLNWFGTDTFIYTMRSSLTGLTGNANVVVNVKYPYSTEIISAGTLVGFNCYQNSITRDGMFVAWSSDDPVTGLHGAIGIYDRGTKTYTLARNAYAGVQGVSSVGKIISDDGAISTFHSADYTIVNGDTNGVVDVFAYDNGLGAFEMVSVDSAGGENNGNSYNGVISGDGTQIAFQAGGNKLSTAPDPADNNGTPDVFVHDITTGNTALISQSTAGVLGDGTSKDPGISLGGQFVTFESNSTNLDLAHPNPAKIYQIYLHDRDVGNTGTFDTLGNTSTTLISINGAGVIGNGDSSFAYIAGTAPNLFVVYSSNATNLDSITPDTNGYSDAFLYNVLTGVTTRISVSTSGEQANGGPSGNPQISEDGVYALFQSDANKLVTGDTGFSDIFIRDTVEPTTNLVTINGEGSKLNGNSIYPSIGTDGYNLYISYSTNATNIDTINDTDSSYDIYVQRRKDIYK